MSFCVYICLSVCLSVCLSIYLFIWLVPSFVKTQDSDVAYLIIFNAHFLFIKLGRWQLVVQIWSLFYLPFCVLFEVDVM